MINFSGFEIVPADGMLTHGPGAIRITVSAKKVALSGPLIRALKNPEYISFHWGVGENEGKIIIAAADEEDAASTRIQINSDNGVFFYSSDFVDRCCDMLKHMKNANFGYGTFYSIMGKRVDDETEAYIFDLRNAQERCVKNAGYSRSTKKQTKNTITLMSTGFNYPMGYGSGM